MTEGVLMEYGQAVSEYTPYLSMTLILMGDWCSEVIADTLTYEISARVKSLETGECSNTSLHRKKIALSCKRKTFFS
jgi:hypothetical protein